MPGARGTLFTRKRCRALPTSARFLLAAAKLDDHAWPLQRARTKAAQPPHVQLPSVRWFVGQRLIAFLRQDALVRACCRFPVLLVIL